MAKETKTSTKAHLSNKPNAFDLGINDIPIDDLIFPDKALKRHPIKQIRKLKRNIPQFGFLVPILIDENNVIIAGTARVLAAKELGMKSVPAIEVEHMTEENVLAFRIADNRISEDGDWISENVALAFKFLDDAGLDLDFTGFDAPEIDLHFELIDNPVPDEAADQIPSIKDIKSLVSLGDLWKLGEHTLYCGSALEPIAYQYLLSDQRAHVMVTDPPYNVPIKNHVCGKGEIKHTEFKMASGEMTTVEFTEFLTEFLKSAIQYCEDGALIYCFMDWRHLNELHIAALNTALKQLNLCVWKKTNAGMGSFYRSQHELIAIYKKGDASHQNNIELGKHGRNRTNVWEYPSVNSMDPSRKGDLALHPTVKPVAMIADAIRDCSKRGQIILDPFAGSGTTIIASEMTGRIARCIELDPHYCDVILYRFEAFTGEKPIKLSGSDAELKPPEDNHIKTLSLADTKLLKETDHD